MALVNIATLYYDVIQHLKKIRFPGGIELLSYKRNRSIAILVQEDETLLLKESGYKELETLTSPAKLAKDLKVMVKREFPRSRKVRLVKLSHPDELERKRQKI
jgi:16S rRNA C1402 (ribose-2'-O) methylase RsmI